MGLEFRRHAQDKLVQRLKTDTQRAPKLADLMHQYTSRGPGLFHERAKAARKKLKVRKGRL